MTTQATSMTRRAAIAALRDANVRFQPIAGFAKLASLATIVRGSGGGSGGGEESE